MFSSPWFKNKRFHAEDGSRIKLAVVKHIPGEVAMGNMPGVVEGRRVALNFILLEDFRVIIKVDFRVIIKVDFRVIIKDDFRVIIKVDFRVN